VLARSAELCRKILKLGQAIAHRQNGLGIVDMDGRTELERWQGGCKDIDETEWRMIGHEMAAAFFAVLALTDRSLLIHADMLGAWQAAHGHGWSAE